MILMSHIRDEIKKLSQRYSNRLEEHFNILMTNFIFSNIHYINLIRNLIN